MRPVVFALALASPSLSDATGDQALWTVLDGGEYCQITEDGRCVTDGEGNYGNDESCTVRAEIGMQLFAVRLQGLNRARNLMGSCVGARWMRGY